MSRFLKKFPIFYESFRLYTNFKYLKSLIYNLNLKESMKNMFYN